MNAIQTIQLTKKYKDLTAVDRLNLEIQKGDLFSLLGVNGAGKITTIKMLTCLTKPSDGDAIILGNSITWKVPFCSGFTPLRWQRRILYAVLFNLPVALLFIAVGLLCGSVFNTKQVGGICGALFTNLAAWLSGIWFDLNLIGGAFKKIAYALPFVHAVELERAVLDGNWANAFPHLIWVLGYGLVISGIAVLLFLRQMKRQ